MDPQPAAGWLIYGINTGNRGKSQPVHLPAPLKLKINSITVCSLNKLNVKAGR